MTAGPFSTTRVYRSFAITVLRHGNRFDDRTPLKLLSLPHLPPHVTVLVAHPFILPPPATISLQLLHSDTRIPIPTCALDRFTSTQFPNTSSHSGSHASQNTPSRSTRREHEYYAHRVSATHFNHGGSLHPSQRTPVPASICGAWNIHLQRIRPYARICAMRISRRILLWYISAGTYVSYKRSKLMAMNVTLTLESGRGRLKRLRVILL